MFVANCDKGRDVKDELFPKDQHFAQHLGEMLGDMKNVIFPKDQNDVGRHRPRGSPQAVL